jgi:hypothetical protein
MRTIALLALLFAAMHQCAAQMMDASQYRNYMDGLDTAAERWQAQVNSIDVGKMNITYATGKLIEDSRRAVLSDLKWVHSFIETDRKVKAQTLDEQTRAEAEMAAVLTPQQKADPKIREIFKPKVYEQPLTTDIEMEWKMGETLLDLTNLLDALPSENEGLLFQGNINSMWLELLQQQAKLRLHISSYADKLQSIANVTCSK